MTAEHHAAFMRRALDLARRGWGGVHPNPMVGAVVVRDGVIVGEGWHAEYGGPHAEVMALHAAGEACVGATLYVTLEPCAHEGKTPPCTSAIIDAQVSHVVIATPDPHPAAAGGSEILGRAGVEVTTGVEGAAARMLNASFFHEHEHTGAWFTLKLAVSVDGCIAARPGERTSITGDEARAETHRLRAGHDAVLIGIGTALTDDPLLTVRDVEVRRQPARIVLDRQARLPVRSQLVRTVADAPVTVVCGRAAPRPAVAALRAAGVTVLQVDDSEAGVHPGSLSIALRDAGMRAILVEGGRRVATALLAAGLIRRLHLFVAPVWLGKAAVPAFALDTPVTGGWSHTSSERFGPDVMLTLNRAVS